MRAKEGEALFVDFIERVGLCRRHIDAVAARAPAVAPAYRAQLLKRLREAGLELDLDDERVLREIALFADRCDVSEEITRFRSHLDQLAALLKSEDEIGRKADFILQETGPRGQHDRQQGERPGDLQERDRAQERARARPGADGQRRMRLQTPILGDLRE